MRPVHIVPLLLAAISLTACRPDEGDVGDVSDAVDLRRDFPEPPESGAQWMTPEITIPAYTEQEWCYFSTYEGPTVGINYVGMYQTDFGHHVTINATNAEDDAYPDGTLVNCDEVQMADLQPMIVGGVNWIADPETHTNEFDIPGGMAARLGEGQRVLIQSHYVNTSADAILVQDAVNVGLIPEDEVETWTAALVHTQADLALPPGQESTVTVDCSFDQDTNIYFMVGHLHEWGAAFSTEWMHEEGTETIYDVPVWDPAYRDLPPVGAFDLGEFQVKAGDSFRTTCTWYNDEDYEIGFPQEMCATAMMVYPAKVPVVCEP